MKNSGSFGVLNCTPIILVSHKDLQMIRHVVALAPDEAQWFHRVEKIQKDNTVYYRIYDIFLPKQWCSLAQVESSGVMMQKMYEELQEKRGVSEAAKICSNMNAWCHSHGNIATFPSGQDHTQFREQCKNASDAGGTQPQIMLIFNKKDSVYSKIVDFELGLVFEHVPIEVDDNQYDFSELTAECKEKFMSLNMLKI